MSRGVYVRGVSVQEGICPGVHVRGGYVLEPVHLSPIFLFRMHIYSQLKEDIAFLFIFQLQILSQL